MLTQILQIGINAQLSGWRWIGDIESEIFHHDKHCSNRGILIPSMSRCCEDLKENSIFEIVRKLNSETDLNAIKVINTDVGKIDVGFLRFETAAWLAPLIDSDQIRVEVKTGEIVYLAEQGTPLLLKLQANANILTQLTAKNSVTHDCWKRLSVVLSQSDQSHFFRLEKPNDIDSILKLINQ